MLYSQDVLWDPSVFVATCMPGGTDATPLRPGIAARCSQQPALQPPGGLTGRFFTLVAGLAQLGLFIDVHQANFSIPVQEQTSTLYLLPVHVCIDVGADRRLQYPSSL